MHEPQEIERSYLLRGMPPLPPHGEVWRIAQGYLAADASGGPEGRVRSIEHPDGRMEYVHTIKHGFGLVRKEVERAIDQREFARLWPLTKERRLAKVRHRVAAGDESGLVWEIDRFLDMDLVLAEVELPAAEVIPTIPPWLAGWIVREVTEEPEYRNSRIALRASGAV